MIITLSTAEFGNYYKNRTADGRYLTHFDNYEYAKKLVDAGFKASIDLADDGSKYVMPIIYVNIQSVEDIMKLPKILGHDVIIQGRAKEKPYNDFDCNIMIYDDLLE